MTTFTPKVVLFDWDGVVVDSSAAHEQAWERMAAERGLPLPPGHFERGFGKRNEEIIPDILGWSRDPAVVARLADIKEEAYRAIVREEGIEPLPGVRTFLRALREAGIHRVVGSSTPRANLDTAMEIMGLTEWFDDAVSGGDVRRGKPDPEVFVSGAARVGCAPAEALVLEDALVGIEAARAGGMPVVAVATTNPVGTLGEADAVVASVAELRVVDSQVLVP